MQTYTTVIVPEKRDIRITLPFEFIGKELKILVREIHPQKTRIKKNVRQELTEYFSSFRFDVKTLKMTRDEANER